MKKILIFLSLVSIFLLLIACADTTTNENEDLELSVSHIWGTEVFVPKHDKYPIGLAYAEYLPILKDGKKVPDGEEARMIWIGYFANEETSETYNEHMNQWKEDVLKEIIYEKSYNNQLMIGVTIEKNEIGFLGTGEEEIEIEGHQVMYNLSEREQGKFAYFGIDFDNLGYGYSIMYRIDEKNSVEDAIEFTSSIIRENK